MILKHVEHFDQMRIVFSWLLNDCFFIDCKGIIYLLFFRDQFASTSEVAAAEEETVVSIQEDASREMIEQNLEQDDAMRMRCASFSENLGETSSGSLSQISPDDALSFFRARQGAA